MTVTRVDVRPARVLVVDDHVTFAELLSYALGDVGMECVGTAHCADEAVALARKLQPDIVVMDIEMPRTDGIVATRQIRDVAPNAVVAVLTAHRDPDWVVRATQAGASAFIPKHGTMAEMLEILGRIQPGQMLVAPSTFAPRPAPAATRRQDAPPPRLTDRERQVLECLSQGMQVKNIARVLGIAEETCRGYVKGLHSKLDVRTSLEAVIKAQRLGVLGPPDVG